MGHTRRRIRTLATHLRPEDPPTPAPTAATAPPLRVGLIGDSEHGKYGHGLQKLFIGEPGNGTLSMTLSTALSIATCTYCSSTRNGTLSTTLPTPFPSPST